MTAIIIKISQNALLSHTMKQLVKLTCIGQKIYISVS